MSLLYKSSIESVEFSISGSEDARKGSYVAVESRDLFRSASIPFPKGVYDPHLGTTDNAYKCQTCFLSRKECLGHEGHIELNYPVWNPVCVGEGRKWLKLICFSCGHPVIPDTAFMRFPSKARFNEAVKLARSAKSCHFCKEPHPQIKKDREEPLAMIAEITEDGKQVDKWTIYPHMAAEIFARVSDETVTKLGKTLTSHPRNFVLTAIKVPSVVIRPDIKKIGGGRSTNDDLTTALQNIVVINDQLSRNIPQKIDSKLSKTIFTLNSAYYDFVKAGGEDSMLSLAKRFKGKTGLIRGNQLGKRVWNMCRSTIVGSPLVGIDQVGMPLKFARVVQMREVVRDYNKEWLLRFVHNGRKRYPGATRVIKAKTGHEYDVDSEKGVELENGDIVYRDIIDGDIVGFNRQPSLMISNISAHRVVVIKDPRNMTIPMNVIDCPFFNADFDGDQMHLIIHTDIESRCELMHLASVPNWLISHTTSSPAIGQVDDSIIGLAELTRSNVRFDKYHYLQLFQNTSVLPNTGGRTEFTGRDAISELLADTPINFTRTTEWYKPNMAAFMHYDPTEIKVVIKNGKHIAGVLDKKSIGKGANGGLYHVICNEFGPKRALEVMYNMQQVAISYILQCGYTIGIMDLLLPKEIKKQIDTIAANIMQQSNIISDELVRGEIIPPIGKTVEEFYEERQINTLSIFDDFTETILKAIDPDSNNLFKLIMFGSKGKLENMFNMVSAVGQKLINGERIRQKFGPKRTLAYFPRFDLSPESRGYIPDSYLAGNNTPSYVFGSMAARFDLISKALSTSITGEQNRKSIKNLESIIVSNFRWATKNQNVIQFAYGEDLLDPRKVERVRFPTVMISDADFESKYYHKRYPRFFERMKEDRRTYREIFLKIERMNVRELMKDERQVPFNLPRIIENIVGDDLLSAQPGLDKRVKKVEDFCHNMPYILTNHIQERAKAKLPALLKSATWLFEMYVMSYLHPKFLEKITNDQLERILKVVRYRYEMALIDPGTAVGIIAAQAFSEPLTQYMLDAHRRSASGGTSKSTVNKAKEILGARDVGSLSNPTMLIPVIKEYASDQAKVQEIANNIEMMKLHHFVSKWQVFFEKFGEPVHSKYRHERKMFAEFAHLNPLLKPPGDLIKWCIRVEIDKTSLVLKNMPLELIVNRLREQHPSIYVVYTPENAPRIVLRIYMRNELFKGQIGLEHILKFNSELLATTIRGVDGILNTTVVKMIRNKIAEDGSVVRDDDSYGILTSGTNMAGVLLHKYVDKYNVLTDAIQEVARVLGIEAARQRIVSELRNLVDVCNHRHYLIYADEMTFTGRVTSIERSGLKTREGSNVLLRMGFQSPITVLEEAALNSMRDSVTGVTAPLLVGSIPKIGTLYNQLQVDVDFVQKNTKSASAKIEEDLL